MLGRKGGITILEMAIVLVVAASVVVIASRWFMVTQARAKQSEAKQILRQIYVEEQAYHRNHGTYWAGKKTGIGLDGDQDTIWADQKNPDGFSGIKVKLGASAIYNYEISADVDGFRAVASANIDDDDTQDVWSIDQSGVLVHDLDDIENRRH